jgi:rhamnulokinase
VIAVPASSPDYAYISSGTWSLMGIETNGPHVFAATEHANFTNEGGACGTTRLLKNIMGLWLVQECRRAWRRQGHEHSYADLAEMATEASGFGPVVEPDDPAFLAPADMPAAIAAFCIRTGQHVPESLGAFVRCCLESLALKYRWTLERLEEFRGRRIDVIHIVGGGTRNRLLCRLAADATGRQVIAGPVEATAIGNLLLQAVGRGHLASLEEVRTVVRNSFALEHYDPSSDRGHWEDAYMRFLRVKKRAETSVTPN